MFPAWIEFFFFVQDGFWQLLWQINCTGHTEFWIVIMCVICLLVECICSLSLHVQCWNVNVHDFFIFLCIHSSFCLLLIFVHNSYCMCDFLFIVMCWLFGMCGRLSCRFSGDLLGEHVVDAGGRAGQLWCGKLEYRCCTVAICKA